MKNLILAIFLFSTMAVGATKVPLASGVSGTLPIANGGTGKTSFTSGFVKSNGTVLSSAAISASADLTGAVAIANGGTGQTTKAAAFDALSPMTASGDLTYGGPGGTGVRLPIGASGTFLKSNGSGAAPSWSASSLTLTSPTIQVLSSGSTYTTPAGVLYLKVRAVGAGGGGGGGRGGGNGGTGGTTTFNSITAIGGGGGIGGQGSGGTGSSTGGTGGTGTTNFRLPGNPGQDGAQSIGLGAGGNSALGTGAAAGVAAGNGVAGLNGTGGGGSGGMGGSNGGGGAGGEYFELFIPSPAASYGYTIGAGGTAGSVGTSATGGAGGSGVIIIEEYRQ